MRYGQVSPRFLSFLFVSTLGYALTPGTAVAQGRNAETTEPPSAPVGADAQEPTPPPAPVTSPSLRTAPPAISPLRSDTPLGATEPAPTPVPPKEDAAKRAEVFADDWWSHVRPSFTIHGYFRTRAELFHNFSLGRSDPPAGAIWQGPIDTSYRDSSGNSHDVVLCGKNPSALTPCRSKTQAGANMRFRLDPELHLSDNLRVISQIDMLDNVVLGSTPAGTYTTAAANGSVVGTPNPYAPRSIFTSTSDVPTAGQNSLSNSISIKRAYGEYMTPVGLLRFGRQPNHWGLGILANAGDTYDSDWQSTVDRIMFTTGIKSLDLYFSGAWDFINEGAIRAASNQQQGQPYDAGQLDDVNQYTFTVARKRSPEVARRELSQGQAVVNGGLFFVYRKQTLANDSAGDPRRDATVNQGDYDALQQGLSLRRAQIFTPDLWAQILYKKFRFEVEGALNAGSIQSLSDVGGASGTGDYFSGQSFIRNGWKVRDFILATQSELKLMEDRLRLQFGFGWATGDADSNLSPNNTSILQQRSFDRSLSTGRFHPDYRVDLILFRNILSRVQGAYYFRPSAEYDFIRNVNGQKLGGSAAIIWSRASEFVQAPGHQRDLGVELDATVYYQAKDGALNDNSERKGGFYTFLQYGVLFPLGGLGYLTGEKTAASNVGVRLDTSAAQTLRWYMGVLF